MLFLPSCRKDAVHNPNSLIEVRLGKPHRRQRRGLGPRVKSAFLNTSAKHGSIIPSPGAGTLTQQHQALDRKQRKKSRAGSHHDCKIVAICQYDYQAGVPIGGRYHHNSRLYRDWRIDRLGRVGRDRPLSARQVIMRRPVLGEATENGDCKERQSKRSH